MSHPKRLVYLPTPHPHTHSNPHTQLEVQNKDYKIFFLQVHRITEGALDSGKPWKWKAEWGDKERKTKEDLLFTLGSLFKNMDRILKEGILEKSTAFEGFPLTNFSPVP